MASPACNNPVKSKITKIKLINKRINNTHRVVLGNVIFQTFGEQGDLAPVFAFDKTLHRKTLANNITGFYHRSRFDTVWTRFRSSAMVSINAQLCYSYR